MIRDIAGWHMPTDQDFEGVFSIPYTPIIRLVCESGIVWAFISELESFQERRVSSQYSAQQRKRYGRGLQCQLAQQVVFKSFVVDCRFSGEPGDHGRKIFVCVMILSYLLF